MEKFQKAHRRFLAILLLALRAYGDPQPNYSLSIQEHKMLTSIHSNTQDRVVSLWPVKEIKRTIDQDFGHWNSQNFLPVIKKSHLPKRFCRGWLSHEDIATRLIGKIVSVKMQHIQSWIIA